MKLKRFGITVGSFNTQLERIKKMGTRIVVLLMSLVLLGSFIPIRSTVTANESVKPIAVNRPKELVDGDAEDVELISQIGGVSYAVAVQGVYAYLGVGAHLIILDVSDPLHPVVIGKTDPLPDIVEGIVVSGNYAYVADGSDGLRIIDTSDLVHPSEVGFYDTPGAAWGVAVAGNYAYVAANWDLRIIDISNPVAPIETGIYDRPSGSAIDVAVSGNYAYVANGSEGLCIVDISNPATPIEVGSYDPGYAEDVVVAKGYAYVVTSYTGLHIIDVSNPATPIEVGSCNMPGHPYGVVVAGSYAYVATSWDGLRIVNISNPAAPTEVGFYYTPEHALDVAVAGNHAYVADDYAGLRIIDISNPTSPSESGFYDTSGYANSVAVVEGYAYVAGGSEGLRIIEVIDSMNPSEVGSYDMGHALSVAVSGNYAYVVDGYWGMDIINISNPVAPTETGSYCTPEDARNIAVADNYAYIAGGDGGLYIIDISNPTSPSESGFYDTSGYANSVAVVEGYAYVTDGSEGLRIIDVSRPVTPTEIGFYNTPGYAQDVAVVGNYAHVADGDSGLRIIDISNPTSPQEVGYYGPMDASGVAVVGSYAYLVDEYAGLQVIDISDLTRPHKVGYHDTPGYARDVTVVGNYVYVADERGGLLIFRFTGGPPPCKLDKQPILLVPGWGGSEASLTADEQLGFFREWLGSDYNEGCNLFYAMGLAAENSLDENAMAIQKSLQKAHEARLVIDPTFDGHFDIIAHSYGGINSRRYLESDLYGMDRKRGTQVDNLFTMGTPHGGESLPTAGAVIEIAWKHIIDWRDWGSIWQALPRQMEDFNRIHDQKEGICYRLIGGNAYEQDLPSSIMAMYSFFQHKPNDLGIRVSTAQELSKERWKDKYPNVVVATTPDIHGYTEKFGLADYRSYVHPADTFDEYIKEYLGRDECVSDEYYVSSQGTIQLTQVVPSALPAVLLDSGMISSSTSVTGAFDVDWEGQSVIFLNWSLGELEFSLTNPEEELIDSTTALTDPNTEYFELETIGSIASYVFTNTITGTWRYTVTADPLSDPTSYQLTAIPSLPVAVTAQASSWQRQGDVAIITATLSYSGSVPLTDGQVEAQVFRPDGRTNLVSLHELDDGVYTADYLDTDVGGYYGVLVEATGIYETQPYTRHAETSFTVATDAASLTGEYSDQPRDTNGDGRYEWLDIGAKISVTQVGTYTLAADLVADDGSYIGHVMSRTGLLTGTHNLALSFDGDDILGSGQDGPYTLTNLLLVDSERASLLLDQADDAHITAAYNHQQFGSWRLYLPVILRNP